MTLTYLDIETRCHRGAGPGGKDKWSIATIQHQDLTDPGAALVVHADWRLGGERGVLEAFQAETRFLTSKWGAVAVGFNLGYEFRNIWERARHHGFVDAFADPIAFLDRPHIDVQQWALLANGCEFKGASLDNFSGKTINGRLVPRLLEEHRYGQVEAYIRMEAAAFIRLFAALRESVPQHWLSVVAPRLGLASPRIDEAEQET